MRAKVFLSLFFTFLLTTAVFAHLDLGQNLELSLTPNNSTSENFNFRTNTTEEVNLSYDDFNLVYNWENQVISNATYKNFTFIIPFSSNLSAKLNWTNSTNNLTFNLTNLRINEYFENTSGGNYSTINLNISETKYGVWKATVFGENVSGTETFNLTIYFLDNRFKINFTEINHNFENKTIENNTVENLTFYVEDSVEVINISLNSNASTYINLSLHNSTGTIINSTNTTNGSALVSTTNLSGGYWTISINNTNLTTNFTYNLTISLTGNNITKLGNLTNESYSLITFNLTSPENLVVGEDYKTDLIFTTPDGTQELTANINFSAPVLKLRPAWKDYGYIGNQSLDVGETEIYNTSRRLFINLNQTKTLSFIINNTGTSTLINLTQINSTNLTNTANNSFVLNFTSIALSNNISAGGLGYLNITIEPPTDSSYLGNYTGWIYLNSSNGEPYNYLNLTLNIIVTNQTLPRLNLVNNIYYINDSTNLTPVTFEVYSYDNQTLIDNSWNTSKDYNFTLKNLTGIVVQNISFSVDSNGLFSANINTTNLSEGNYTLLGNTTDEIGNIVEINSSFELLHNLNPIVTSDLTSIVKGFPFDFTVNVSKLGNFTAENVSVCLDWSGSGLNHSNSSNCTSIGNINITNSGLATWNFTGYNKANYTVNITVYSEDGRFNYTKQQEVVVRYGTLVVTWKTEPPTDVDKDSEFYVKVYVNNTGNLNVTGVLVNITYSSTYFTKTSGDNISCADCDTIAAGGSCSSCYWYLKPIKVRDDNEIEVTATGNNATLNTNSENVNINTPTSDDDSSSDNSGTTTYYGLSFLKPTSSSFYIAQGGTYDLEVELKNTGNAKLNDLYLTLSGLDSDYYSITPSVEDDLSSGSTREYTIHFSIPDDFEANNYDLTLEASSDEKDKEDSITLTVKQTDLQVYEVTDLNITQGEIGTLTFYIKNTGEATLHNIYPALTGISSDLFEINSSDKITLYQDDVKYYAIKFTIPKTENIGAKEINLAISSDEINISEQLTLTIIPSEEEKLTINNNYEELVAQLKVILNKLEKAKNENKNISSIISGIESANFTLAQIEKYISNGNYAEAKSLIANLDTELNSMSLEFENLETMNTGSALLIMAVVAFSIILAGIIVAYTFLPKKGYTPGKGYTMMSKKNELEQSIKNIFKKLGVKKSEEEHLRKKKLIEWKKWYKQETKKRKY
ncbi:MAG: hypothetical protein KAT28_01565 [Candidatus Aenigmarchaeota archaeon]|nr:hypothetical protein [Candidatus Aenigmarchaeota archaeon]